MIADATPNDEYGVSASGARPTTRPVMPHSAQRRLSPRLHAWIDQLSRLCRRHSRHLMSCNYTSQAT